MIGIVSLTDDVETWAIPLMEDLAEHDPDILVSLNVAEPGEGSYAQSINELAEVWLNDTKDEWFVPMNADVSCHGPITEIFESLESDKIYAPTINEKGDHRWIDGWLYIISREVWERVGKFDEKFKIACFEDADYTWRAVEAGVGITQISGLPFYHHKASPRMRVPNFWKIRKENQAYLVQKWNLGDEWSYR